MKLNIKITLFLVATVFVFYGVLSTLLKRTESLNEDVETQRKALIATAEAYYNQGVQVQYDSDRKNLYDTPEDATSQRYVYTVCSGFTFQAYYQTLGIEIPYYTEALLDYAEKNKENTSVIIKYYGTADEIYNKDVIGEKGNPNYTKLAQEWIDILQPGDVFVFTGHAMLVHSIDKENNKVNLLDAVIGSRYNYGKHKDSFDSKGTLVKSDYAEDGTMKENNLEYKLRVLYNKMNKNDEKVDQMAIIRFITDGKTYIDKNNKLATYTITKSALSRLKFPEIDIEKTIKISNDEEVVAQNILTNLGEFITYELTIKNNSNNSYSSFDIVENIDDNLIVTDTGDGKLENGKLKWNVSSMKAGEIIKKSYTVRVPIDTKLLGKIIVSTGYVDDIATSKIETLIGNKLNKEEREKIFSSFEKLKSNTQVEREFINQVYEDSLGIDLGLSGLKNLDIISYDSSVSSTAGKDTLFVRYTKLNDVSVKKYIYHNFYGLRIGAKHIEEDNVVWARAQWNVFAIHELNDRARSLSSDMLIDGDIILLYTGDSSTEDTNLVDKSYLFLNNKLVRKKTATEFEEIAEDELTVFLRDIMGENFIILRPSIGMERLNSDGDNYKLEFNDNLTVDNENKYIKYLNVKTKVSDLFANVMITGGNLELFSRDGDIKSENDILATGDILKVYSNDDLKEEYVISVIGDSNGDSYLDLIDLVQMRKHIVGWVDPSTGEVQRNTGVYYYALDFNQDNIIDLIDLVRLRKTIVGWI